MTPAANKNRNRRSEYGDRGRQKNIISSTIDAIKKAYQFSLVCSAIWVRIFVNTSAI